MNWKQKEKTSSFIISVYHQETVCYISKNKPPEQLRAAEPT